MNKAKEAWLVFARKAGDVQVTLIFKILYFLLLVPIGFLASRIVDFLDVKTFPKWSDIESKKETINSLREQ